MKNITSLLIPIALLFCFAQALLIFSTWTLLPPLIPLFYSLPWGENQLSPPFGLFILPASTLIVTIFNSLTGITLFRDQILTKNILSATALVYSFLSLISLIQIIRLVI